MNPSTAIHMDLKLHRTITAICFRGELVTRFAISTEPLELVPIVSPTTRDYDWEFRFAGKSFIQGSEKHSRTFYTLSTKDTEGLFDLLSNILDFINIQIENSTGELHKNAITVQPEGPVLKKKKLKNYYATASDD